MALSPCIGSVLRQRMTAGVGSVLRRQCHGPWTLIEAEGVRGRRLTSWPSLRTDLRHAGATWEDKTVNCDGNLVTARKPDDRPEFCREMLKVLGEVPQRKAA
jgi:protease I